MGAAITSESSEEQLARIKEYAVSMGIAFQIKDDILDYVGDVALGKPVGIDLMSRRLPSLFSAHWKARGARMK